MELVVTRHLLDERTAAVVLEHDEVADERQEPARLKDPFEHDLQLRHVWIGQGLAGDRPPGLEPLPAGGQRADPRLDPVGDHEGGVHGEQRRKLGLVGPELLPRAPDSRVLVRRVLELDHPERQAVYEQHYIRAALVLVLDDGELVDRQPVVVGRVVEIDNTGLRPPDRAVLDAVLHRHAIHDHAMEGAVAGLQHRPFRAGQLGEGVVERRCGKGRVEPRERVAEPTPQHHLAVIGALGILRIGGDFWAVDYLPAEILQPN